MGKKVFSFLPRVDGFYVVSIHRNQALLRTHMVQNANSNRQNQTNKQKKTLNLLNKHLNNLLNKHLFKKMLTL